MKYKGVNIFAKYGEYQNGQPAIELFTTKNKERWMVASVAIEQPLLTGEVAIKNYSENEGILDTLLETGIIAPPHRYVSSGFVTIPICKLLKP